MRIYDILLEAYGPRGWWPGDGPFEVTIGAILTQNTAWANVEKALGNLKAKKYLSPKALADLPEKKLATLIRPSGYYNQKAKKIKNFLDFFFSKYSGSIKMMARNNLWDMREELLAVKGIGDETADSILLYALEKPIFVVDAYTIRIFCRLGYLGERATYRDAQKLFMDSLPPDVELYNEYHALIVALGHRVCKPKPWAPGLRL